jgi:elongation factor Ts
MAVNIDDIKKLREQTGAGIADCREAIEEAGGDLEKAKEVLKKKGLDKAASKSDREAKAGLIHAYIHGGKIGSLVEVNCETDFVAKTEDFKALAQEVAMQVASMNPENVEELLEQDYIRDNSKKIKDLVTDAVAKLGENIQIGKISRIELGK